jgi:gamma-glutamylcyclotransferase (GGCT)/AIG2-like uncharacterized protein YtfP
MTELFMYGKLLVPEIRRLLRVVGRDWAHNVCLEHYSLTTDWNGVNAHVARLTPTYRGVVYGNIASFTDEEMQRIDQFEGVPHMYQRGVVHTNLGEAVAYLGNLNFFKEIQDECFQNVRGAAENRGSEVEEVS